MVKADMQALKLLKERVAVTTSGGIVLLLYDICSRVTTLQKLLSIPVNTERGSFSAELTRMK